MTLSLRPRRRTIGDPRYVVIDLDFATAAEAEGFLDVLRTAFWSSPDRSPALDGTPTTIILQPIGTGVDHRQVAGQ